MSAGSIAPRTSIQMSCRLFGREAMASSRLSSRSRRSASNRRTRYLGRIDGRHRSSRCGSAATIAESPLQAGGSTFKPTGRQPHANSSSLDRARSTMADREATYGAPDDAHRHATPQDLPRRQVGRLARPAGGRQPGRSRHARGRDVQRHRGAVRGGRRGGGGGLRAHARAAGLRARPRAARDQQRDQGAARGDRADPEPRGRQAHPRRAGRGRPGDADVPARRRGGRADVRRDDPARPDGLVEGPGRHHPPLPDRPGRGHQPVQLPAEPRRPQGRAGDRRGLLDRPQAAVEGPAHDAHRRGDHRRRRAPGGRREHPADDPRAGRPDGRRRPVQAPVLHRQPVGRAGG